MAGAGLELSGRTSWSDPSEQGVLPTALICLEICFQLPGRWSDHHLHRVNGQNHHAIFRCLY